MSRIKVLVMALVLAAGMQAYAQDNTNKAGRADRPSKEEMVKSRWHALAGRMMLTDKQTQQLESTYCDYINELSKLKEEKRSDMKEVKDDEPDKKGDRRKVLSDEQVAEMTVKSFDIQRKRIDIKEKYFKEFCKVLSARQANYLLDHNNIRPNRKKGIQRTERKAVSPYGRFAPRR
mgnify:CR=1 FL=1